MGTCEGFPQPTLISLPLIASFFKIASEWKWVAELLSRKEMKAQFLSGRRRTDSIWPLRTWLRISSADVSAGMLPRYTVRLVPDKRPGVTDAAGLPKAAFPKPPILPLMGDCGPFMYCWLPMPSAGIIPEYRPFCVPCVGLPIWFWGF